MPVRFADLGSLKSTADCVFRGGLALPEFSFTDRGHRRPAEVPRLKDVDLLWLIAGLLFSAQDYN